MSTLIQADIFFFISSVSILILVALLIVIAFYVIRVVKDIKEIVKAVKSETKETLQDFNNLRSQVKAEGGFFKRFLGTFFKTNRTTKKSRNKD
jgi:Ca2+/Na+ antiporter